jgi:hypothetical protein
MQTYRIDTDGFGGFVVKVLRSDGEVHLTSPMLRTARQIQSWIDEHTEGTARSLAAFSDGTPRGTPADC